MTQVNELLTFLREAVTPFHAVQAMSHRLADAGFEAVESFDPATMVPGSGYADKHDDQHSPHLGGGPVIKINRNQRYATDSEGAARLRLLAERAGVDVQAFVMRADLACGSTIGPITATETGIPTTDLGVPTLAMHSIRELACVKDIPQLKALLQAFYRRLA